MGLGPVFLGKNTEEEGEYMDKTPAMGVRQ